MFEAVMLHDLRWRLHHRDAFQPVPALAGGGERVAFRQRNRNLFGELVRRLSPDEPAPRERVSFRQRDRRLFASLTGERAPASAAGAVAVPFQQRERRLFAALVGGAVQVPLPADLAAVAVQQRDRRLFEAMVARQGGRRVAQRGAWTLGAAAFQVVFVSSVVLLTAILAARSRPAPALEVQLVRAVYRRPAPPPPAAMPMAARRTAATPRPSGPAVKPRPPAALVQPREIAEAMKAPDPSEPVEVWEPDEAEGVEGGVVGGVPGYVPEPEVAAPSDGGGIVEAPRYVTTGFRAPAEVSPGCVGRSVRLPQDLAGFAAGQVVVKFAVGRDGTVGLARLMTPVPDQRIFEAIRQALESCRWRAGADAQGRPVTLWVILPLRFAAE